MSAHHCTTSLAKPESNHNDTVVIASLDANNGVSNANTVIDLECTTLSAKDAEGDTLEQATDLDANNGISNAYMVIDSERPTLSAKDAVFDILEQATDLKETSLYPNSTVDTHDFANAGTDEACNDPCDEIIDSNAEQEAISEAFGDSKMGVSSGQNHEASNEQSLHSLQSDFISKFHVRTRVTVRCDVSPNYFLHGKVIKVDAYNQIYTVEFDEKDNADPQQYTEDELQKIVSKPVVGIEGISFVPYRDMLVYAYQGENKEKATIVDVFKNCA
jgi:hypothetical protein